MRSPPQKTPRLIFNLQVKPRLENLSFVSFTFIHCEYCFISHAFYVIFPYTNLTIITQDVSGLGLGPGNGLGLTERDNEEIDSHRHLYVGFHVPKAKRTEGGKHHHHHGIGRNKHNLKPPVQNLRPGEEGSVLQPGLTSSSFEEFP